MNTKIAEIGKNVVIQEMSLNGFHENQNHEPIIVPKPILKVTKRQVYRVAETSAVKVG